MNIILATILFPILYVVISFLIAIAVVGVNQTLKEILKSAFITPWPFHIGFLTLAATATSVILALRKREREQK